MSLLPLVTVYTDGSYHSRKQIGGWAAVIVDEAGNEKTISGHMRNATSQRMELIAAIKALKAIKQPSMVTVVTDNRVVVYALNGLTMGLADQDLLRELDKAKRRHRVTAVKVEAHRAGVPILNSRSDFLAKKAMYDAI